MNNVVESTQYIKKRGRPKKINKESNLNHVMSNASEQFNNFSQIDEIFADNIIYTQSKKKIKAPKKKKMISQKDDDSYDLSISDLNEDDKMLIKKNYEIKQRIIAVEKIIEACPHLKKDKLIFINIVLDKKEQRSKEYVLEKIKINNEIYYSDNNGNLFNCKVALIGVCVVVKNISQYHLFSENKKQFNNLLRLLKLGNKLIEKLDQIFLEL